MGSTEKKESKFWEFIKRSGAIIGLFGGCLGLILTYNTIKSSIFAEPQIRTRLVSFATSYSTMSNYNWETRNKIKSNRIIFMIKVAINVLNKDISYFDIIPYVKYDDTFIKAEIYYPKKSYTWTFDSISYYVSIPKNELLYYNSMLYKNETNNGYLNFYIDIDSLDFDLQKKIIESVTNFKHIISPKSIKIDFITSDNKGAIITTKELKLDSNDDWRYAWEEDIWIKKE